jgi:hypothetical protein
MSRKGNNNRNRTRNGGSTRDQILRGQVQATRLSSFTGGVISYTLAPSLTNITTELATVYRWYRFVDVKVTLYPIATSQNNIVGGYVPGGNSTQASTNDGLFEARKIIVLSNTTQVPQCMHITRDELVVAHPWYVTEIDAVDPNGDIQGFIKLEGNGTESFQIRFDIEYEFKYPKHDELAFSKAIRLKTEQEPKDAGSGEDALPPRLSLREIQLLRGIAK